jgi:hypothetical protein
MYRIETTYSTWEWKFYFSIQKMIGF